MVEDPHDGVPDAVVALSDGTLFVVSSGLAQQLPLMPEQSTQAAAPVIKMALSPDEKVVSCFTKRGHLHVLDINAGSCLYVIETKVQKPPNQMIWCGTRVSASFLANCGQGFSN